MSKHTTITVIDDLTGAEGAKNISFCIEGVAYEIDLVENNRAQFLALVAPYVSAGRRAKRQDVRKPVHPRSHTGTKSNPQAPIVRAWAKELGLITADRGRIAEEVYAAFYAMAELKNAESKRKQRRYPEGIRDWARTKGHKVGNGKIEDVVLAQFFLERAGFRLAA